MDEQLPSYREATRGDVLENGKKVRKDVVDLIVPYVDPRDYYRLCLVSKGVYALFSPLLTKNPIRTIRALGLRPDSDLRWYGKFIKRFLEATKTSKSDKIITMDLRGFRTDCSDISNTGSPDAALATSVLKLLGGSSDMRCLVLDGRTDLEVSLFAKEQYRQSFQQVRLLSMANCQVMLPITFFGRPDFQRLVYLDISNNIVWGRHLLVDSGSFTRRQLPGLRILKLGGLGIASSTAFPVLSEFERQLWSLDLSGNDLWDDFVDDLMVFGVRCEPMGRLQTDEHFQVEGKLRASTDPLRGFYFVDESASSATFSHPDRYLADPPSYAAAQDDRDNNVDRPRARVRLTGTEAIRGDSAEAAMRVLDGGPFRPIPNAQQMPYDDLPRAGLTHLRLNDLHLLSRAVEKLLAHNRGSLEHFECNRALIMYGHEIEWKAKAPWLSNTHVLYGFPGASYLFRPVFQPNLRVLKMHHSLVTNVPTLACDGTCVPENLWLAETRLRERMDLAYPQTYVPDMNPRLYSLTLSKVPRYSTGVVIERLVNFLRLAAAQEQGIEQTRRAITHHRGATVLRGLRHIRLEFDPDPAEELHALHSDDDDVAEAMSELALVSERAWDASASAPAPAPDRGRNTSKTRAEAATAAPAPAPALPGYDEAQRHAAAHLPAGGRRLTTFPFDRTDTEYYDHPVGGGRTVPVWIGPGVVGAGAPPAVDEYMRILASPAPARAPPHGAGGSRSSSAGSPGYAFLPTAATPCQVAAGAPAGALVFGRAWDHVLVPPEREVARPAAAELRGGMRDVLEALKAFRRGSRARYAALVEGGEGGRAHDYWKGRLDIELAAAPRADSSAYWR